MKKWSALSPSTDNPVPPQRRPFPFRCPFGATLWESRASEPLPIHASSFGRLFPYNNIESLLSPEEQPPPQEPERFLYRYKKTARSISTGSGRFLLSSVRQRTAAEVLPSSPHFYPQHSGRLSRQRNSCRAASPPVESPRKGGCPGRKILLQKGLPPPVSFHRLTSTRHLSSPYAAQTNDILLISFGPLDGGGHDAEALQAEALLTKQQHFVHRLLA